MLMRLIYDFLWNIYVTLWHCTKIAFRRTLIPPYGKDLDLLCRFIVLFSFQKKFSLQSRDLRLNCIVQQQQKTGIPKYYKLMNYLIQIVSESNIYEKNSIFFRTNNSYLWRWHVFSFTLLSGGRLGFSYFWGIKGPSQRA